MTLTLWSVECRVETCRLKLVLFAALLRLELQPQQASQVRMWERKFFYVFKVWSEVSPQAELCLPPEEKTQDRPGDGGPVRQLRPGLVPGQQPAW